MESPFKKLIRTYKTKSAVARVMGMTRQSMDFWQKNGIPLEKSIHVEIKSGGIVTAEEIVQDVRNRYRDAT